MIGLFGFGSEAEQRDWTDAFVRRMAQLGWTDGVNLKIEYRWADRRHERFAAIADDLVKQKVDLIVISAGALADDGLLTELRLQANNGGSHVRVASGAIAGLDALSAAALGGVERVTHTIRKPARRFRRRRCGPCSA